MDESPIVGDYLRDGSHYSGSSERLREAGTTTWASDCERRRGELENYLVNPEKWSDLWMKRGLFRALKPVGAEKCGEEIDAMKAKGANVEVYEADYDALVTLFKGWYEGGLTPEIEGKFAEVASYISRRFVFKIGNTRDYPVNFSGEQRVFLRERLEWAFAPLGFRVVNSASRIKKNLRDVARMNLFAGNERESPVTGPFVHREVARFLKDPLGFGFNETADAFFVDDERSAQSRYRVDGMYTDRDDPAGYERYIAENGFTRDPDDDGDFDSDLKPFFDGLITVGFHSIVRRVTGYNQHTDLTYAQAKKLIKELCHKHKSESFVVPEHTSYGYDPRKSSEDWSQTIENNEKAVDAFAACLKKVLPNSLMSGVFHDESTFREFCHRAVDHFHAIPNYEVDISTSAFSPAMAKLLVKSARIYFANPSPPRRTDFERDPDLRQFFGIVDRNDRYQGGVLRAALAVAANIYSVMVRLEKVSRYERLERTHVKTQDNLRHCGENASINQGPFSVNELLSNRADLLEKYPELAEKLVVYFYQTYKMYKRTGYVPDMRPENVAKGIFGFGEWALQTNNVQVKIVEDDENESVRPVIVNIDPEDHFRDTTIGRRSDEGLATSGLGLLREIGVPATKKAMARFLDVVARHRGIRGEKRDMRFPEKTAQFAKDVGLYGVDVVKGGTELAGRTLAEETERSFEVLTSEVGEVADVARGVGGVVEHFRDLLARKVFPNL